VIYSHRYRSVPTFTVITRDHDHERTSKSINYGVC